MNWLKKFWVALTTYETPVKEVDELKETERGSGGFGSTGVK